MTMKKIFATLVVCFCFTLIGSNKVYASTFVDLSEKRLKDYDDEYQSDSAASRFIRINLENYIQIIYERTGEEVTWIMHNLNDNQSLQIIMMYENGDIKTYNANDIVCKSHKYFRAGTIMQNPYPEDLGFPFNVNMKDTIITRNKFSEEAVGYGSFRRLNLDMYIIENSIEEENHHKLTF